MIFIKDFYESVKILTLAQCITKILYYRENYKLVAINISTDHFNFVYT